MKLHRYRTLLCAVCCFALALVAAAPGRAIGAPITITTIDDLQKIGNDAAFPLNGDYLLGGDIDATVTSTWNAGAGFAPIGASGTPFTGSFDGQGHVIRFLSINRPTEDNIGLFGYAEGATLKNIGLDNATVSGDEQVGGLVGESDYGFITNCSSKGAVTGAQYYAGGLVGYNYFGSITNCSSAAAVTGVEEVGGLVGENYLGSISSCSATGAVTGSLYYVGGLVGYNDYGPIANCFATGDVTGTATCYEIGGLVGYSEYNTIADCYATGAVTGNDDELGGLVGESYSTDFTNCYATGAVTGGSSSDNVGGLVGYEDYSSFKNCYATGAVSGYEDVGGLIGYFDYGSITDCYATGAVTGTYEAVGGLVGYMYYGVIDSCNSTGAVTGADSYTGGLVGYNEYSPISNSYATGTVAGEDYVGGLIGYSDAGAITNCYATGAVTGTDDYVGGLIGYNDYASIRRCYASGAVTGSEDYIGGLVGYTDDNAITDCFATGAVTGSDNASTHISSYVGGLVGYFDDVTITTSYSAGAVSGNDNVSLYFIGGLVGDNDSGLVSACFWDNETSGLNFSDGGEGKTTALMKTKATFTDAGWNFATIWDITEGQTYPLFRAANKAAVAVSDNYTTKRNTPLTVEAPGVLANDTDRDNDNLTAVLVSGAANGTVALNADGSFVYIPDKRFKGEDSFTYKANDGVLDSAPATVTITVGRKKLCPAVKLYGEQSGQVRLLRTYRDTVLAKTAAGSVAVDLYYELAPMVDTMLDNSPYLVRKTKRIIDMLLPSIKRSMKP